jgi:bifunctional DNA-binding transcriptional regulator/antitoxin component of YhaV-PrlF toxin-antitoxin module
MKKPVYKLLDEKGRVLIPLEMRQKAEIEKGDVVEFSEEEVSRYFYVEPKGFAEITFKLE